MPYKVFVAGEEALASDANSYLMSQTVPRFTSAAQRTSQMAGPALNQLSIRDDRPGTVEYWNGTAWVAQGSSELYTHEPTTSVAISSATAAASQLVAGGGSWTFDGGPVLIEFYAPQGQVGGVVGASLMFQLYDSATDLGYMGQMITPAAGTLCTPVNIRRRLTPTAGAHSFKVHAWIPAGGTANVGMGPGGVGQLTPGLFRVSRCA